MGSSDLRDRRNTKVKCIDSISRIGEKSGRVSTALRKEKRGKSGHSFRLKANYYFRLATPTDTQDREGTDAGVAFPKNCHSIKPSKACVVT